MAEQGVVYGIREGVPHEGCTGVWLSTMGPNYRCTDCKAVASHKAWLEWHSDRLGYVFKPAFTSYWTVDDLSDIVRVMRKLVAMDAEARAKKEARAK